MLIPLEWPSHVAISELVAEYWGDMGVKVDPRSYNIDLVGERLGTNDYDIAVWFLRRTNQSKGYLPSNKFTSNDGHYAPLWWQWHHSGGESGEEPPDEFKDFFKLAGRWYITPDKTERDRIATQLFDFASEQVLLIGTVGYAPVPIVVSNEMGNVPRDGSPATTCSSSATSSPTSGTSKASSRSDYDRLLSDGRAGPRAVPTGGGLGAVVQATIAAGGPLARASFV